MTEEATPEVEETAAPDSDIEESATSEETTESPETEETEDTTEEPEKPKPKGKGFQKRINKLTREKRELEARISALEQGNRPQKETTEAPRRDDFDSYEDYLEAKADYVAEKKVSERLENQRREQLSQQARETQTKLLDSWEDKKDSARERYDDFDDVVDGSDMPITPYMSQAILESNVGADIAYYLAGNEEEVERIASLSPARQSIEIGKLEAKLEADLKKPKTKPPSKAPDPVKPTKGKSPKGNESPADEDSMDEWVRKERERMKRKFG